jgi:hypothetical protein
MHLEILSTATTILYGKLQGKIYRLHTLGLIHMLLSR